MVCDGSLRGDVERSFDYAGKWRGEGYPIGRLINSKEGEMLLHSFKQELCIYGPGAWNHPDMVQFWAKQGIFPWRTAS
ncbi:MAG: hypothetical protein HFI42_00065 [Lachnospiraceae bacterium]|nr:hypothetical protein [Lachnospiraceae bacterium]